MKEKSKLSQLPNFCSEKLLLFFFVHGYYFVLRESGLYRYILGGLSFKVAEPEATMIDTNLTE